MVTSRKIWLLDYECLYTLEHYRMLQNSENQTISEQLFIKGIIPLKNINT